MIINHNAYPFNHLNDRCKDQKQSNNEGRIYPQTIYKKKSDDLLFR